jgi:hypothetical protein
VPDSLNEWRWKGWWAGKHVYKIQAFAEINRADRREVPQAIFTDAGVELELNLPKSAQRQIQ